MQYKIVILDVSGDTTKLLERPQAEELFMSLKLQNAVIMNPKTESGSAEEVKDFDPEVHEYVALGRVVGG